MLRFQGAYGEKIRTVCENIKLYQLIVDNELFIDDIEKQSCDLTAKDVENILKEQCLLMNEYNLLDENLFTAYKVLKKKCINNYLLHYEKVVYDYLLEYFDRIEKWIVTDSLVKAINKVKVGK